MNKIILLGNLTRDPESKVLQERENTNMTKFSLAVNRRFNKGTEQKADFFNCVCYGNKADFVQKYFGKGSRMMLSGRLQNNNYTNKNGEKVYSMEVVAEEIEFAEKKHMAECAEEMESETQELPLDVNDNLPWN